MLLNVDRWCLMNGYLSSFQSSHLLREPGIRIQIPYLAWVEWCWDQQGEMGLKQQEPQCCKSASWIDQSSNTIWTFGLHHSSNPFFCQGKCNHMLILSVAIFWRSWGKTYPACIAECTFLEASYRLYYQQGRTLASNGFRDDSSLPQSMGHFRYSILTKNGCIHIIVMHLFAWSADLNCILLLL